MNILGLHFGHDAAACVVVDGEINNCILRERLSRIKHAISLDMKTIDKALGMAGLSASQIDLVAITSTQDIELIIDDPSRLQISLNGHKDHSVPSPFKDWLQKNDTSIERFLSSPFLDTFYDPSWFGTLRHQAYTHYFPEHENRSKDSFSYFPWLNRFIHREGWIHEKTLQGLFQLETKDLCFALESRLELQYPVTITLDGYDMPAYFVSHHGAHAASSFYNSPFDSSIILTHDGIGGGLDENSGIVFYGEGECLYPLIPHHLAIGHLYEMVGSEMGLGDFGSAGKLMGLSAYGLPHFFDEKFIGNYVDWYKRDIEFYDWLKHLKRKGKLHGYEIKGWGDGKFATERFQKDVAASTQKLFEETILTSVELCHQIQKKLGLGISNLCLSGGCFLNCPANERISTESAFSNVFVEPGCDDSGLAIGAALYAYHNICSNKPIRNNNDLGFNPYLGTSAKSSDILSVLSGFIGTLDFEKKEKPELQAAQDLMDDLVIGWFQGRSEIGPRALGNRSILANPTNHENWERVNKLKKREAWRPFAPAVLEEESHRFFRSSRNRSPYMLFNAEVFNKEIPAVTHVDHSARIQTVSQSNKLFHSLISSFFRLSGTPVIMNTSFNGPGEPIVESIEDAVNFFIHSKLDVLYLENFRIIRSTTANEK